MRSWLVVVAVATLLGGCGRLGFDARAGGVGGGDSGSRGGDGGGPGDGPLPLACTSTGPEICNGLDDNCNGLVDEGCPCTPVSTSIAESPPLYSSQFVWTGNGYLQLGGNAAQIGLWPIDAAGNLGAYGSLYNGMAGDTSGDVSVAWNGSKAGIAFDHNAGVVDFATYDPKAPAIAITQLDATYPGAVPQVAWAGDHFTVAWGTVANQIITRDVASDGTVLGPEKVAVTGVAGGLDAYQLTSTGAVACVRAMDSTTILVTIDSSGTSEMRTLPIGIGNSCRLLPIPGGFLAWNAGPSTAPVPIAFLAADGTTSDVVMLPDIAPNPYSSVAIESVPTGFWVLATHNAAALYSHAIDEIGLDFQGNVTTGPTQLASFDAYLWSAPESVATAGRQTSIWSQDLSAGTFSLSQACP